jgi:hypothetical protein
MQGMMNSLLDWTPRSIRNNGTFCKTMSVRGTRDVTLPFLHWLQLDMTKVGSESMLL